MQIVAFHLVRLRDGKLCDRVVFRDDYIRLKRAQGLSAVRVSADATLLTVLSLRRQAFHVFRCERRRRRRVPGGGAGPSRGSRGAGAGGTGSGGGSRRRWGAFDGVTQGFGGGEGLADDGNGGADDDDDAGDPACVEIAPVAPDEEESAGFVVVRPPIGARCEPDDDAPLRAQDAAEARWRERRGSGRAEAASDSDDEGDDDEDGAGNIRRLPETSDRVPMPGGASPSVGWSDPRSPMYTGLKQKVMTRAFLEARRRDAEEWQMYAADAAAAKAEEERARRTRVPRGFLDRLGWGPGHDSGLHGGGVPSHGRAARDGGAGSDDGEGDGGSGGSHSPPAPDPGNYGIAAGKKRKRASSSSFSFPVALPPGLAGTARIERPRNRHVSAFRSRYWYYAEWMCAWHCGFLDVDHVAVRMGTADDVLAWGRRAVNGRGVAGGDYNRCPATVLVAVVRLSDGAVVHVGDLRGEGGGLLGVESSEYRGDAGEGKRPGGGGNGVEWSFGEEPPPAEGTEWARLAPCTASAPRLPAACVAGAAGPNRRGLVSAVRVAQDPASRGSLVRVPVSRPRALRLRQEGDRPRRAPSGGVGAEPSVFRAARAVARVRARVDRDAAKTSKKDEDRKSDGVGGDGPAGGEGNDDAWLNALVGGRGIKSLRFKLPPSAGEAATLRMKRSVSHMFHPVFPFAMSVSRAFMQPQVVSFHFRE